MKNAIILHGTTDKAEYYSGDYPSLSNSNWLPWLQKQLLMRDIAAVTPEIPNAFQPDYEVWRKEVERYPIGPETLLVGHSCGGGFWVRWLSEHKDVNVGRVVLVAPWLDPDNIKQTSFFDFQVDRNLTRRSKGFVIFGSDDDGDDIKRSIATLRQAIYNSSYREFHNYGHFCIEDMQTQKFPEVLNAVLSTGPR